MKKKKKKGHTYQNQKIAPNLVKHLCKYIWDFINMSVFENICVNIRDYVVVNMSVVG